MISASFEKICRTSLLAALACSWSIQAAAEPYCPSRDGRTITCNGCLKELDCDVNNSASIIIRGHDVTFDGGGHLISNSTGVGIAVLSTSGSTIRNVYIHNSASDGIFYSGTNSQRWGSSLFQVDIEAAKGYGVHHDAGYPLDIDECIISYNTKGGVWSELTSFSSQHSISIVSTEIQGNGGHGVYVRNRGGSHFYNNLVLDNVGRGAYFVSSPGLNVELSQFFYNGIGLSIPSGGGSIQLWDNVGGSNGTIDCSISSSNTTVGGTNSWGTSTTKCNPSP